MHIQVKQRKKLPNTYGLKQATVTAVGETDAKHLGEDNAITCANQPIKPVGNRQPSMP